MSRRLGWQERRDESAGGYQRSIPGTGDTKLPGKRSFGIRGPYGLEGEAYSARMPVCPVQCYSLPCSSDEGKDAPAPLLEKDGAQTKEERLNAQVRVFVTKAQKGMSVSLCDTENALLSQCLFRIDETASRLTFQTALAPKQTLWLRDLKSVVKGEALAKKLPHLAHASRESLLLVFGEAPEESLYCLLFQDTNDRNEFHTNMRVLRVMATSGCTVSSSKTSTTATSRTSSA